MVEPRKSKEIKKSLKKGQLDELIEYDRLLSERFSKDPSIELSPAEKRERSAKERRLNRLGEQLFAPRRRKK